MEPQNGHVKRATPKVIHRNQALFFCIQAIGQSGCRRFVEEANDLKTGQLAGVFGRLPLRVVEIRRNGNDHLTGLFLEGRRSPVPQGTQNNGRDLRWCHLPVVDGKTDQTGGVLMIVNEAIALAIIRAHMLHAEAHKTLHRPNGRERLGSG